jgi:hypothetical protein
LSAISIATLKRAASLTYRPPVSERRSLCWTSRQNFEAEMVTTAGVRPVSKLAGRVGSGLSYARARPAITHDFASIFEAFGEKRSRRRQIRATMAQPIAEEGMR